MKGRLSVIRILYLRLLWFFLADLINTFAKSLSGIIESSIVSILSHILLLFFVRSLYLVLGVIGVNPVVIIYGPVDIRRCALLDYWFGYWVLGFGGGSFDIFDVFGRAELVFLIFGGVGFRFVSSEVFEGGDFAAKSLHSTDLIKK